MKLKRLKNKGAPGIFTWHFTKDSCMCTKENSKMMNHNIIGYKQPRIGYPHTWPLLLFLSIVVRGDLNLQFSQKVGQFYPTFVTLAKYFD